MKVKPDRTTSESDSRKYFDGVVARPCGSTMADRTGSVDGSEGEMDVEELHRRLKQEKRHGEIIAARLQDNEARFRYIIKHCPVAVSVFDRDLRYLMVSDRYLEARNLRSEEIVGQRLYDVFPELPARWRDIHARVLDGAVERSEDDAFVWPNGTKQYERWQCRPWYDAQDRIGGMIVYTEFITAHKQTEAALQESRRRYATLIDNLPGMVYRCQPDSGRNMEFISDGSLELTGYRPPELMDPAKLRFKDLIVIEGESYATDSERVAQALARRQPYQLSYRIRTAGGKEKWVWEWGGGVFADDGELLALEGFITDFTDQKKSELALRQENIRLKSALQEQTHFGRIVGKSPVMQKVYALIRQAAGSDANVIILGESGTGKELVARAIHESGDRARRPFVAVNCSAIPEGLVENEFFGHCKGAFSGAHADKKGYLSSAHGGSLFLDEVGDISLSMQAKLLRAMEDGFYTPVGDHVPRRSDFRVIGATHQSLSQMVHRGLMREDFFYRLSVIPITLPPLRRRREDIPLLVNHILMRLVPDGTVTDLTPGQMDRLLAYDWLGNVRELQNVLHRFLAVGSIEFTGPTILSAANRDTAGDLEPEHDVLGSHDTLETLEEIEKKRIAGTLQRVRWNRTQAAAQLGISRRALFRRIEKYDLQAPETGELAQ